MAMLPVIYIVVWKGFTVTMAMVAMAMARGQLNQDIMAMHPAMTTEFRDSMAITDMVRDLLSLDMVDIMDRPMSMKTVFMVLMVAMDMARGLLSLDMVDIMDMHMSMKTVSMVLMVTMADMVMAKDQLSLGMDMAMLPAMTIGSRVSMAIMVTMGTKLILNNVLHNKIQKRK